MFFPIILVMKVLWNVKYWQNVGILWRYSHQLLNADNKRISCVFILHNCTGMSLQLSVFSGVLWMRKCYIFCSKCNTSVYKHNSFKGLYLVNVWLVMLVSVPVAVRSKASVCNFSIAGIIESVVVSLLCFVFVVCFVGSGLCDGLISRVGESCRLYACF